MDWASRGSHSIFGMCVVDAFDLATGCQGTVPGGFRFFLEDLITALIDNKLDQRSLRKRRQDDLEKEASLNGSGLPQLDTIHHLTAPTPTKKRKTANINHRVQGPCMVCKKSTTHVCRTCQAFKTSTKDRQYWICNKAGKECMGKHILDHHTDCIGR
jgi:hypothetical protein